MERGGRRGGGGGRRGRGRGGGGRGGGGRGGGGGGGSREEERNSMLREIGDEFDEYVEQRNIKGEDGDDYRQEELDDDDDDDEKGAQRMTTKFKWEEDTMEEEFNEAGERMEPFNLKGEREEGYFDKTGNFIWRKEDNRTDAWLGSLDQEEEMEAMIGQAALAKRKKEEQEAKEEDEEIDTDAVKAQAMKLMRPGENVLTALKRLGPKRDSGANKKPGGGRASVLKTTDTRTPEEKAQFDELTECADKLLQAGMPEIYELDYEELQAAAARRASKKRSAASMSQGQQQQQQQAEGTVGPPKQVVRWQYKGADGQVHGPFSTAEILQWRAQGYFTGPTAVSMRFYQEGAAKGDDGKAAEGEEPPAKKKVSFNKDVSFSADALAADFDDDDEEEGAGGPAGARGKEAGATTGADSASNPWVGSDSINFSLYA